MATEEGMCAYTCIQGWTGWVLDPFWKSHQEPCLDGALSLQGGLLSYFSPTWVPRS